MSTTATPTKRRVLGALDANALARSPSRSATKLVSPVKKGAAATTATPSPKKKKRSLEEGAATAAAASEIASPAFKKLCSATAKAVSPAKKAVVAAVAEPEPSVQDAEKNSPPASARRSLSPDASSLFDNSISNTSQLTNITEPDTTAPITATTAAAAATATTHNDLSDLPPPRPRRVPPTREEFRRRAEILKLRLSLASYKVKTNQTDVPLDKLQVRPVPGNEKLRLDVPSIRSGAHTVEGPTAAQFWYRSVTAVAPPAQAPLLSSQESVGVEEEGTDADDMSARGAAVGGTAAGEDTA